MKKLFLPVLAIFLIVFSMACSKSKGNSEANLQVTTDPPNQSTQPPKPAITFSLNVTITSPMPPGGVKITVTATPEGGSTAFFTITQNSSQASNDFTITNTPPGKVILVAIVVTSLSKSSNTWSGSYRYSAK
jgi:hypothetical protein